MRRFLRPDSLAWLALVAISGLWVALMDGRRIAQLERVSEQAPMVATDDASPTGYAHGTRGRLLPLGGAASQAWVIDTQAMAASGSWQIRHASYDNAPEGRPVHGASPYRWWLRLVAESEGGPLARAVESAAFRADPALHVLLVVAAGLFAVWRFGPAAGGMLALGVAALFSQTQIFSPGRPHEHGLFLAANLAGMLLLLAGWSERGQGAVRFWLGAAGAAAGLGLWVDAGSQLAVLGACWVSGLAAITLSRSPESAPLPWRLWALGGSIVAVTGWFVEARPGGLTGAGLGTNHPLLLVAWFGGAELLVRWPGRAWRATSGPGRLALLAAAVALVAPLVWLFIRTPAGSPPFGPDHPALAGRLGLVGWLKADGVTIGVLAALLPLGLVPAALWVARHRAGVRDRLVFALATLVVLGAVGFWELRWWGVVDVALLALLVLVAAEAPGGFATIGWRSGLGLLLLPGLVAGWPTPNPDNSLAPTEARALVERDIAQWLALRAEPGAIAFAPPALSGSLCYYGGLRVVASPYPGNQDGLTLAVRIAATTATDEAQALLQRRGIQYVVLPSWDDTLDRLARAQAEAPDRGFVALLRQWLPPRWLRPVAYQMPVIPGLERDSVAVFEVVEPQENVTALSRLAEYFVETGRLDLAAAVGDTLEQSFAADAGAMIARAKVALARGETRTLARIMPELLPAIADGRDEDLPWERRANLAVVLAQTKHPDLARHQVEFCLQEADAERLRSLGPVSLFRLLTLARAYRLDFADPALRPLAMGLLPAEFQAQLPP
jgi:hypothetical protein